MSTGLVLFTLFHVALSLLGIVAGFVVVYGLLTAKPLDRSTALFLSTTVLTGVTGFLFPFHKLLPSHILGIISLVLLPIAIYARYSRKLAGAWNPTYSVTAVLALYLNFFVLIVQLFEKVPALHALAPTQTEQPFKLVQLVVLLPFVLITIFSAIRFRHVQLRTA